MFRDSNRPSGMRSFARAATVASGLLAATSGLPGCGGGGGGDKTGNDGAGLGDAVIALVGSTGKYSQTPEEANQSGGAAKPPVMPTAANGVNQYFRLQVPFNVRARDIMTKDSLYAPFSQLIGNLSVTDELGNHVRGIAMVNGVDAFGNFRGNEPGFPQDLSAGGSDNNVGPGVILYVADDGDNSLATVAAFGGRSNDSDLRSDTTDIVQIRISLDTLNNHAINAFYTINVNDGTTGDTLGPRVLSVKADTPDPTDPLNPAGAATTSRFIIQFSEPCIPTSVGKSAALDGTPFLGNMPLIPTPPLPPSKPLPHTHISTLFNQGASPLFLPCDVRPLNSNNLAVYVVTPLIDLPANRNVDLVEVDANANQNLATGTPFGAMDLSGNLHAPGAEVRATFGIGPGRAPVNAPVSPEVIYWLPSAGRGIGAIDLNGRGFNTNTPGRWSNTSIEPTTGLPYYDQAKSEANWQHAAIVTKGGASPTGIGIFGLGNPYGWKVGTGSYLYGPPLTPPPAPPFDNVQFQLGAQKWVGNSPTDLGNPGTPFPGINEMSSGFETLVRNAEGDVILTGRDFGAVGTVNDLVVGQFLDAGIFDTQSVFNGVNFHTSFFFGGSRVRNSISDPPHPNPPPLRYWVGLQPVDVLIDQQNPLGTARLIEGSEPFAGTPRSYGWAIPNQSDPLGFDVLPQPGRTNGCNPQSATAVVNFTARQQIGNYLYAADAESGTLQVINSNTFQVIASIEVPEPAGVAVAADSRYVFTSNAGDDTMSVIGAEPTQPDFHQEIARIRVGRGPTAIACEPDSEDVFVVNTLDDTISIVQLSTLSVRKTLTALIEGPRDVAVAPRQNAFGFSAGVYFAYIANTTGNSVVVYESGPDGPQGIGCNDVLGALPTTGSEFEVFEPRALVYSPYTNYSGLYAGGVFVAHRTSDGQGLVTHIQFTHQALFGPLPCVLPPGQFFIPPGFNVRLFEIVGQWGVSDGSRLLGSRPSSLVLNDLRHESYSLDPSGSPNWDGRGFSAFGGVGSRHPIHYLPGTDPRFPHMPVVEPDRLYVAFDDTDRIQILDPVRVGIAIGELNETTGVGVKKLVTFYSSQ